MWFASSIINLKLYDLSEKYVGQVVDLLFTPKLSDYPKIDCLLIKTKEKKLKTINFLQIDSIIPYHSVNLRVQEKNIILGEYVQDDFASMRDSVIDQQIVDLKNAHVIRVNDVKLGFIRSELKILGVDISFQAILRRIGFGSVSLFGLFQPLFIDFQEIQILKGESIKVNTMMQKLKKLHPADLADIVEKLNSKEREKILDSLEEETVARIIEEVDDDVRKQIIQQIDKSDLKDIFENMNTDDVVDVIQDLPEDLQNKVISTFDEITKKEIDQLSNYEEDTVGGLMTTDFIEVSIDWSVKQTIEHFRKVSPDYRSILYIYVVDSYDRLKGSVSARGLLCAEENQRLRDIYKPIPTHSLLKTDQEIKEIIAVMTKYNLYNAAVSDEHGKMIGLVSIDDVLRALNPDV
jgi:hypothetical protein